MRISFRQEVSSPPVASMGGTWIVEAITADESRVRLLHDFRAVDDDPESPGLDRASGRPQQQVRACRAEGERGAGHGLGRPGDDVRGHRRDQGVCSRRLRLPQRGAALVGASPPRGARLTRGGVARRAAAGDGHPDQGRFDAHHQVRPRLLPASAHRVQADRAAGTDDGPSRPVADPRRPRRGAGDLRAHRRHQRGEHLRGAGCRRPTWRGRAASCVRR